MTTSAARIDLHNAEIDDDAARAGLCGMTHLATGRCCVLEARHIGSCRFLGPYPTHSPDRQASAD
jgi:hypothetical protein